MVSPSDSLEYLSKTIGHSFADESFLELALTHRSYCAEHVGSESNERLEFLGDAVLGLAVAEIAFRTYKDQPEGFLAKYRADVVSAKSLARTASLLGVGEHLLLSRGEILTGGAQKESILADAMEAIIAAVYLDGGWEAAVSLVKRHLEMVDGEMESVPGSRDFKTRLQELAAEKAMPAPVYETSSSGPDHKKIYTSVVTVGSMSGSGEGSSKKQAQQAAAQKTLQQLEENFDVTRAASGQSDLRNATVRAEESNEG